MSSKVKVLRSTVAGKRPTGKEFGELWVNDKDKVMGYIDSGGQPVVPFALPSDIVIHNFSATTAYKAGDVVLGPDHNLWIAKAAIPAGAWNATKWDQSGDSRFVNVAGDTMTGPLNLPSVEPTGNNAVSRAEGDKLYVNVTGDTMKGALNLPADGLVAGTDQLVIKGGKVGIGTANPTVSKVVIEGNATTPNVFNALTLNNASGGGVALIFDNSISAPLGSIEALVASTGAGGAAADCDMAFGVAQAGINKERMRLQSDGSLYVHVTKRQPWSPASPTIQIGEYSKFGQDDDQFLTVASGGYEYAAKKWKYMLPSNPALMYQQGNGGHHFYGAPGGAIDSDFTFTEMMSLSPGSLGHLALGIPPRTWHNNLWAFDFGSYSALAQTAGGDFSIVNNLVYKPTGNWANLANLQSSRFQLDFGKFRWWTGDAVASGSAATLTNTMSLLESGELIIGYSGDMGAYRLQVNGQIYSTSSTIATSDARYKENVQPITGALDIVNSLRPVSFDWKEHSVHNFDRSTTTVGFLAQEVERTFAGRPYLRSIVKDNICTLEPEEKDTEGNITKAAVTEEFKGIAEGNLIAILTAAIKEQQALITDLQTRLAALESRP